MLKSAKPIHGHKIQLQCTIAKITILQDTVHVGLMLMYALYDGEK